MNTKQMSRKELMKAGNAEAAAELKERAERVAAAREIINNMKAGQ